METTLDSLLASAATYTAFADGQRHLCTSAELDAAVAAARRAIEGGATATIFNDATGERTEVEPHGDIDAVRDRLQPQLRAEPDAEPESQRPLGPGRPRLGVISREVSLLPRHWDWLATQQGGASAALRRLIDQARKHGRAHEAAQHARDAAARALSPLAGDLPAFEEVLRALYRTEFARAIDLTGGWPSGLHAHAKRLLETAEALHRVANIPAAPELKHA